MSFRSNSPAVKQRVIQRLQRKGYTVKEGNE